MTELPTPGSAVEKNRLDCKARYDDGDKRRFEMAKDVAAFANANGGRLLIGSVEQGGLLTRHVGLLRAEALKTRRDIEEAVRDWIRPSPVVDFPEPVPIDDDNVVLIVDVQPVPGQAVGVRVGRDDGASWVFPVRVGTQTVRYSPEQLVLLMDVALRRKVQLLSAAKASGKSLKVESAVSVTSRNASTRVDHVEVEEIDERSNSMRIVSGDASIWISLDLISSVWREGDSWAMRIERLLSRRDNKIFLSR